MKKLICLTVLALGIACVGKAQNLGNVQFQKLIGFLSKEDWQSASDLSKHYIDSLPKTEDAEPSLAVLRYMFLTSQAGLMNEQKLTKDQALKAVKNMEGHWIVMPWRNFNSKMGSNQYSLAEDKPNTLFCNATNLKATSIFAFEYIELKNQLNAEQFAAVDGKTVRMRGRIKSISVEGNMFPRFRLLVNEADFHGKE